MLTFSPGVIQRLAGVSDTGSGNQKSLFLILIFLLFSPALSFAQCPSFSSNNTNIKVDGDKGDISISTTVSINFVSSRILLYDYDRPAYYYDSWHRENTINSAKLDVNINPTKIEVRNLPPGDFVIIVERQGCDKAVVGRGYSGFPDSGIKID